MPTDSENGRLSEKTVSGRRTVKATRMTRKRHRCPQIGPSAESEAEGALEAFGEVCHRTRRPRTSRTAPYHRLSLNAEAGGANGHAGLAQPLRAARRCLQ